MGSENRALALSQPVTPSVWEMIQSIVPTAHKSRLFGVSTPEQAAMICLKGYELGLGITASFEYINIIQERPALTPRGALALALHSGEVADMKIEDRRDAQGNPWSCYVWMKRRGGLEYSLEFTMDDAKRAGLIKSGSAWEGYPSQMLKWRAVGYVLDALLPDVSGGLKRVDELSDAAVDDSGNVVEASWRPAAPAPSASTPVPSPVRHISLDDLVTKHGADAVFGACGGVLPANDMEVLALAQKLGEPHGH